MSPSRALLVLLVALVVLGACSDRESTTSPSAESVSSTTTTGPGETSSPAPDTGSDPSISSPPVTTTSAPTTSSSLPPTTVATTSTTTVPPSPIFEVTVADGRVEGPGRAEVRLGDTVIVRVTADVADEVHVHGYDQYADVAPGRPAIVEIEVIFPGVFEIELEGAGLELMLLEVA